MNISARADYALRALLQVASRDPEPVPLTDIVADQHLPRSFVEAILPELRRADFLRLHRSRHPGYTLARPAADITIGSVLRSVDGPLTRVRGLPPHEVPYEGAAAGLAAVWTGVTNTVDGLLDELTLADVLVRSAAARLLTVPATATASR